MTVKKKAKKVEFKEYLIHSVNGILDTRFISTREITLKEEVLNILSALEYDYSYSKEEAIQEVNESFIVYELGKQINVNVETVITIRS